MNFFQWSRKNDCSILKKLNNKEVFMMLRSGEGDG